MPAKSRRCGLGPGKEQEGINSPSLHPATCDAARTLQEQTGGGGWLRECARGITGKHQERTGGKNVPGQKLRHSLGLQSLGMRLLQSKHTHSSLSNTVEVGGRI